jgi:hypothetical protein
MRIYENLLLPVDEWFITSTIELGDDGRFRYREAWSCYAGSTDGRAEGTWRPTESGVAFETERVEGALRLDFEAGRRSAALDRGDGLDFGNGFIMNVRQT